MIGKLLDWICLIAVGVLGWLGLVWMFRSLIILMVGDNTGSQITTVFVGVVLFLCVGVAAIFVLTENKGPKDLIT